MILPILVNVGEFAMMEVHYHALGRTVLTESNLKTPDLRTLATSFFRIGNTTFGGGYITIGMLAREFVDRRQWLSSADFDLAFALARVTPGTNSIAFCVAIGFQMRRWWGAVAGVVTTTAPSAVIALIFIYWFEAWQNNHVAMAGVGGTVAAVAGMMWSTIWTILRPHVGGSVRNIQAVLIAGGAFLASWKFGVTPLPLIVAGTLIGALWQPPPEQKPKSAQPTGQIKV
ncbi:MAG: chromate transporter [Acidobacteriota bacterium]